MRRLRRQPEAPPRHDGHLARVEDDERVPVAPAHDTAVRVPDGGARAPGEVGP